MYLSGLATSSLATVPNDKLNVICWFLNSATVSESIDAVSALLVVSRTIGREHLDSAPARVHRLHGR